LLCKLRSGAAYCVQQACNVGQAWQVCAPRMPEWFLLDTRMQGIALSVISLAHNLNMRVIAEGVETREQVAFLSAHGCDEMQGYFFSCPVA
jgi:hypothetical protein